MNQKSLLTALLALGALAISGCFTTKIHTAVRPLGFSLTHEAKVHHTVLYGLAELSDPIDLEAACPNGTWAVIDEELTFLTGLVAGLTYQLYTPREYTVHCGAGGAPAGSGWGPVTPAAGAWDGKPPQPAPQPAPPAPKP
jgi:hypothetical protein